MRTQDHIQQKAKEVLSQLESRLSPEERKTAWYQGWAKAFEWVTTTAGELLIKEVVQTGQCTGCAACVIACPYNTFDYDLQNWNPVIARPCMDCGDCIEVCPKMPHGRVGLDEFVFGRAKREDEKFGVYRQIVLCRAKGGEFLKVGQDGGATTAMLADALQRGEIDGAIVADTGEGDPLHAVPKLARTKEELMKAAGSRYTYSPSLLAIEEAIKHHLKKVAFVGTPCHIDSLRRVQITHRSIRTFLNVEGEFPTKLLIGLMCMETFDEDGMKKTCKEHGINPEDIENVNIKRDVLVRVKGGKVHKLPLEHMKEYFLRPGCKLCDDFGADWADLSVGGIGLQGWTLVIVRTEAGEKFMENAIKRGIVEVAPLEQAKKSIALVEKFSVKKRVAANAHAEKKGMMLYAGTPVTLTAK